MKTVGEILKETRIKKAIDFEEIEKATKIRKKYLQALEENDFGKISPAATAKGFIKNYSEYLGLDSKRLLAVFRRDFTEDEIGQVVLRGITNPPDQSVLTWNPKKTGAALFAFLIALILGFLAWHLVGWWLTKARGLF